MSERSSITQLEAEIVRLKEREQHFARILGVPDSGRYRNDWDSRLIDLLAERDRLRSAVETALSCDYALTEHDPEWRAARDAMVRVLRDALDMKRDGDV